jgi:hypothetical protein
MAELRAQEAKRVRDEAKKCLRHASFQLGKAAYEIDEYLIRHCLRSYEFNHLLRTNLSSFYAINNLLRSLNNLPKTNCYAGYQGVFQNDQDIISFCSGSGYLISRDICEYLCLNSDSCEIGALNDDVWVGKVLEGIPRTGLPRTDFYIDTTLGVQLIKKLSEMTKNGELDQGIHFRVKCINEFERINVDSFILFFLYNPRFSIRPDAVDKTTQPVRLR